LRASARRRLRLRFRAHLAAPEATLEGVHEALAPPVLVGCGAGGVVGDGREIERGTAVAVWAAALGGGRAEAFHLERQPGDGCDRRRRACPSSTTRPR
jgi:small ligand-binding sensory domain FIST